MNSILIAGIGGAGSDLAADFHGSLNIPAIAINTDKKSLAQSALARRLLIGPIVCNGAAAGVPARGRLAAEESIAQINVILNDVKTLILVAGLGGGTGTGVATFMASLARQRSINVIAAVTLPSQLEHQRRQPALDALRELESLGVTVFVHDHAATLGEAAGADQPLSHLLQASSRALTLAVRDHLGLVLADV